jgi:hypothetical protein
MVTPIAPGGYASGSPSFYDPNVDVTSIMSTVGGGFVTSLSSGQMIGSDDGFDLATLPSAQYAGEGAWLGTPAGVFTAKQVAAVLTNPTEWGSASGWTTGAANAASIKCPDPDLTSLIAEYPRTNSKKIPLPVSPQCSDFTRNGAEGTYFSWEELSGHLVDVRRDANGEIIGGTRSNPHDWAIVRDLLRDGLDRIWEATGGVRLTAAYRNPARNEHIRGAYWVDKDGRRVSKSDAHIWGLGADVKPLGSGTGPMARPDWDALQAIVLAPGPGGAVWREEFEDAPDHVHGSFDWWPGRPEYKRP